MSDNGGKSFPVESHSPEHSQLSWPEHVPIPESFLCPLSKRLMKHPVVDREGNSFERETILRCLQRRRDPGKGFSPVTKNPLRESDLVDNRMLQMEIDAALKNALEQEHMNDQSTKRARSRRFLPSMKVAMKTVTSMRKERVTSDGNVLPSGSEQDDAANRRSDSKGSHVPHDNSAGTERLDVDTNAPSDKKQNTLWEEETEPLHASSVEETQEHQHTHAQKYSRRNRPAARRVKRTKHHSVTTGDAALDAGIAAVLQAGILGTSMVSALHKVPDRNSSHSQQTKVGEHMVTGTKSADCVDNAAVDKFEERLKKKLAGVPAASAKYEPRSTAQNLEEKLRKKLSMDREASADSKKQSHTSMVPKKIIAEDSHKCQNSVERESIVLSSTKDSCDTRYESFEFKDTPKEERREKHSTQRDSVTTGDAAFDDGIVAVLRAVTLDTTIGTALCKVPDGNSSHSNQTKVGGHKVLAGSAVDKFEERLKKKLEDPAAPAKYELRSTDEISEEKMRKKISMDREASADSKEQSHSSTVPKKIVAEDLHKGPSSSKRIIRSNTTDFGGTSYGSSKRTIIHSNTTDFGVTSRCSSESEVGLKEEVDYAQLQEERRRKRGGRRGMLDQKLRESLATSVVTEIKEDDLHKGPNILERTLIRSNATSSGDTSYGSSEFETGPKEDVDCAQLKEERRRKRRGKRRELDQKLRESLTKSGEHTTVTVPSAEDSMSNERRTGSDREHQRDRLSQLNRPRVRHVVFHDFPSRHQLSGLTIEEGNEASEGISESNHTISTNDAKRLQSEGGDVSSHHSASTNGQVAKDKHDEDVHPTGSSTDKTTNNSNGILHGDLLPVADRFHCNGRDSVISWADLDGEIERAQFLSMKMTNNDAVRLQVELETFMKAGFDIESHPPPEGGGEPVVSQRRSRGRRRGNNQQENVGTTSPDMYAHDVESLLEVVEGTNKTRFDVLDALKKAKGNREEALGILLGFDQSGFT